MGFAQQIDKDHSVVRLRTSPEWLPEKFRNREERIRIKWRPTLGERRLLRRRKMIPPSQWAPKYRTVTYGPLEGAKWDNEFMPHMVGIMDASFFPSVREIGNIKTAQSASSAGIETMLGYASDMRPGPGLIVYPDRDTARKRCKDYLQPMFTRSPRLSTLLTGVDDDLASLRVKLRTMLLYMGWSGSVTSMSNVSAMYLAVDEVDKMARTAGKKEGSLREYIRERVDAFRYFHKIWWSSTPTVPTGHITEYMTKEAQVVFDYHVRCPDCGHEQLMNFDQIMKSFPKELTDPKRMEQKKCAGYVCEGCGSIWDDRKRDQAAIDAMYTGWRARGDGRRLFDYLQEENPEKICFHSPSWISPLVPLYKIAASWLRGRLDRDDMKIFVNNHKAQAWEEIVIETREDEVLKARCGLAPQVVPAESVALVAFVDMQKHGFWFCVRAFARDFTSWNIHHGFLPGWDEVEELLFKTYYPVEGTDRKLRIWRAGLDTGGGKNKEGDASRTEEAYFWLRKNGTGRGCRVWGTKGASNPLVGGKIKIGKILDKTPSGKALPGGLQLIFLDTDQLKDAFHYRLQQAREEGHQAAYLHKDTGDDYAKQITAEKKQIDPKKGETWVRVSRDNHYLDCEVGCLALAEPEWPGGGVNLIGPPSPPPKQEEKKQARPGGFSIGNFERPGWLKR